MILGCDGENGNKGQPGQAGARGSTKIKIFIYLD
jgi:hypothetical protein